LGALRVGADLIADGRELGYAVFQHRVGKVGDAIFDRAVQPLELRLALGRTLAQFGDMGGPTLGAFLPAVKHGGQKFLKAGRL
jgi:hypothetical protein